MAKFTISAHQEMFAEEQMQAENVEKAIMQFQAKLKNGEVAWQPSAEDMDFTVSEQDETGHVLSETSSDSLDVRVRA